MLFVTPHKSLLNDDILGCGLRDKITYPGEHMEIKSSHNYFWYAFQNAFIKAGMGVSNVDNPDLKGPALCG
jgi:hypothetical protein